MTESTLRIHAQLVDRMADTLGLDLEESILRGQMQIDDLSDAVLRCTGCTQPGACQHWLAETPRPQATPPGYCRNSDLFADLKARS